MATHLEHVAARILGRPLLILPQKLDVIAAVLAGRVGLDLQAPELGLDVADRPEPLASRFVGSSRDKDTGAGLAYQRTDSGAALITVTGSLVNRGAWIGASSGLTSYEGIAAQLRAAMADPKVSSVVLDLNSPGGEVSGCFELADLVASANQVKPVTAFVNGLAASAAYAIASGAGRIVSVPSGLTGSIGAVMMHADWSRALDRQGVTPTLIYAGAHKVDGNPFAPLDPETRARMQAELDQVREDFVQLVAGGRGGRLSAKAARDTEAAVFTGREAKHLGLVDELASFDALYDAMNRSSAKGRAATTRRASMSTEQSYTQADLDSAFARGHAAARTESFATGRSEGFAAGRAEGHAAGLAEASAGSDAAHRARVKTILTSPQAEGRRDSALHLATETDMSAEAAVALLGTMAKHASLDARATATEAGAHTAGTDTRQRKAAAPDAGSIYAARRAAAQA